MTSPHLAVKGEMVQFDSYFSNGLKPPTISFGWDGNIRGPPSIQPVGHVEKVVIASGNICLTKYPKDLGFGFVVNQGYWCFFWGGFL